MFIIRAFVAIIITMLQVNFYQNTCNIVINKLYLQYMIFPIDLLSEYLQYEVHHDQINEFLKEEESLTMFSLTYTICTYKMVHLKFKTYIKLFLPVSYVNHSTKQFDIL